MKCYHTFDAHGQKHFIPMCYGTIHSNNIEDCNCLDPITIQFFEKERYNKELQAKIGTIAAMQSEIEHLNKVIVSLKKNNHESTFNKKPNGNPNCIRNKAN